MASAVSRATGKAAEEFLSPAKIRTVGNTALAAFLSGAETGQIVDVALVGGSYAGISAALQVARAGRSLVVLDSGSARNRFATHTHGVFGSDGADIKALTARAKDQLLKYPTVCWVEARAVAAERVEADSVFEVTVKNGVAPLRAKRVVIATGVKDKLPEIPGVAELWGKHIFHCPYCHGYEVKNQDLAVIAASPMSLHQAKMLKDWSDKVTLYTGSVFEESSDEVKAFVQGHYTVHAGDIASVEGTEEKLHGIRSQDGALHEHDAIFISTGTSQASPLAEQLGCEMEDGFTGPFIKVDGFFATSVEGVFAAGDACSQIHSVPNAMGQGNIAGAMTHQSLLREEPIGLRA